MYYIALFFVKLISLLPFWLIYLLSDFLYLIVYHVVGYRRKVVKKNLKNSFPEKTEQDRLSIEKKFYKHFCDLFFEGLKLYGMSRDEMVNRMQFFDYEPIISHFDEEKSPMILISHFGNWEWLSSFSLHLPKDKPAYQVYKRQKNSISDRIIDKLRRRFGSENIEMKSLYRTLIRMNESGKLGVFGMISDQSPRWESIHYWTDFLNQKTAMIDGTEHIARKFNYPVYYCQVKKLKRGHYSCTFSLLSSEPKNTQEHEITENYARLLEKDILATPEMWLWTHKRWKHDYNEKMAERSRK